MPTKKRFRVLLEQDDKSVATGFGVPFDVEKVFGTRGRVPVRGTINGYPFRSTISPMGGRHIMAVNREMREGAGVKGGDTVTVVMERDEEPRIVTPPADLAEALLRDPAVQAEWERLSFTHKKEYARAVEEAKRPETRERRIQKTVEALAAKAR